MRKRPVGRRHLAGVGEAARGWIEAGVEAVAKLGVVLREAPASRRAARAFDVDGDEGRREQPHDRLHRADELVLLPLAERLEDRDGECLRAGLELIPLAFASRGQRRPAHPSIGKVGADDDESLRLERAQEPAEIAGIVAEARSEIADVRAVAADLPEEAGLAERPPAPEEPVAESAGSLRRHAVEPAHLCDLRRIHCLTRVRNTTRNRSRQVPRMS